MSLRLAVGGCISGQIRPVLSRSGPCEARSYSYKVGRLTGDVLTDIVDANNHYMDATWYALRPTIKRKCGFFE